MVTQKAEVKDEMRVQMMAIRHMDGLKETTVEVGGAYPPRLSKNTIAIFHTNSNHILKGISLQ